MMKKRVGIGMLLVVCCLLMGSCSSHQEMQMVYVSVHPENLGLAAVPEQWLEYAEVQPISEAERMQAQIRDFGGVVEPVQSLIFHNKENDKIAEIEQLQVALTQFSPASASQPLIGDSGTDFQYESLLEQYLAGGQVETLERADSGAQLYRIHGGAASARQGYAVIPHNSGDSLYLIWGEGQQIDDGLLRQIASSMIVGERPERYQAAVVSSNDWQQDATGVLQGYLKHYVEAVLPVSEKISGYQINHMEQVGMAYDHSRENQGSLHSGASAIWETLYPQAEVYQVDYELFPSYPDYFAPGDQGNAGDGGAWTEDGHWRYEQAYLVVCRSDYGKGTAMTYMADILTPTRLQEAGLDGAVLTSLDSWYAQMVVGGLLRSAQSNTVGAVSQKLLELVPQLPLREYLNGLEQVGSQTLQIRYDFGSHDIRTGAEQTPGDPGLWQNTPAERVNPYLEDLLRQNAGGIMAVFTEINAVTFLLQGQGQQHTYTINRDNAFVEICGLNRPA